MNFILQPLAVDDDGSEAVTGADLVLDDSAALTTEYFYGAHVRTVRTVRTTRTTTAAQDAPRITTQTRYDNHGRVVAESDPYDEADAGTVTWSDDEKSFLDGSNDPIPTKCYAYDAAGRLASVTLPKVPDNGGALDHPVYVYKYDAYGNQTLIRDPNDHETWFTYDTRGNQKTRTLPLGCGADGIKGTDDDSTLPEGDFTEEFDYDDHGRQTKHVSFEGRVTIFVYDDSQGAGGRLSEKWFFTSEAAYANNPTAPEEKQVYQYDVHGNVTRIDHHREDGSVDTFETEYDAKGRVLREQSPTGAVNYEYDSVSGERVRTFTGTSGTYAGDLADPKNDTQYEYDSLGRLTRVLVVERNGAQIDVDPGVAGAQPEETTYYYDLPGNLDRTDSPGGGDYRLRVR